MTLNSYITMQTKMFFSCFIENSSQYVISPKDVWLVSLMSCCRQIISYVKCISSIYRPVNDLLVREVCFPGGFEFISESTALLGTIMKDIVLRQEVQAQYAMSSNIAYVIAKANFIVCINCVTNKPDSQDYISKLCVKFHVTQLYIKIYEFKQLSKSMHADTYI